jgi:hypothetical protein
MAELGGMHRLELSGVLGGRDMEPLWPRQILGHSG